VIVIPILCLLPDLTICELDDCVAIPTIERTVNLRMDHFCSFSAPVVGYSDGIYGNDVSKVAIVFFAA